MLRQRLHWACGQDRRLLRFGESVVAAVIAYSTLLACGNARCDRQNADLDDLLASTGMPTEGIIAARFGSFPKGLRSFDEHDAGFFLRLLPGPQD